jgi:hypothetical protein
MPQQRSASFAGWREDAQPVQNLLAAFRCLGDVQGNCRLAELGRKYQLATGQVWTEDTILARTSANHWGNWTNLLVPQSFWPLMPATLSLASCFPFMVVILFAHQSVRVE